MFYPSFSAKIYAKSKKYNIQFLLSNLKSNNWDSV